MASDFETFFIFKRRNIELFLFPRDFNFLGNLISLGISVSFWFSREVYKIHECVGGYTRLCVGVYKPISVCLIAGLNRFKIIRVRLKRLK